MSEWKEDLHPRGKGGKFGQGDWASKLNDRMSKQLTSGEIGIGSAVHHPIFGQGIVQKALPGIGLPNTDKPGGLWHVQFHPTGATDDGLRKSYGSEMKLLNGGRREDISNPIIKPGGGTASRKAPSISYLAPTEAEIKSIVAYTNGRDFYDIQDSLRHGDGSNSHVANIDALLARAKPLATPIVVQREIGIQHKGVHNSTAEEIFGPVGSRVGQTFTDKGYTSTTSHNRFDWTDRHGWSGLTGGAGPDGKAAISIVVPKGTKVFKPDKHGKYIKEREILLSHGSKFKIVRDYIDFQGLRRIEMEMMK